MDHTKNRRPKIGARILRGLDEVAAFVDAEVSSGMGGLSEETLTKGEMRDVDASLAYLRDLICWYEYRKKD